MNTWKKVALVSGGGQGIGRAICLRLAGPDVAVVVNYRRDESAAASLADEIGRSGGHALPVQADVSDRSAVRAMFSTVRERLGRLDILVNNAGILHEGLFALTDVDRFWEVMHVNLGGVVNCCKSAIPLLARSGAGRIVNVSSIAADGAPAGLSAYAASKAAIVALSRTLARELAPAGVAVNVVAPGFVDTTMSATVTDPKRRAAAIALQAVRRMGTPDEVAAVVGFLATEAPSFLTGEVVRIDGGASVG